jgi:hypothetical protein
MSPTIELPKAEAFPKAAESRERFERGSHGENVAPPSSLRRGYERGSILRA